MRIQFLLAVALLVSLLQGNIANAATSTDIKIQGAPTEKVLKDSLFALLYPYVSEAVNNYYGKRKQFWNEKIIDIKEQGRYRILVKVQLETFEHSHGPPYGEDLITFRVELGKATVTDYNHKGDEWETKISTFNNSMIQDVQNTFGIDFAPYKKYEYGQLLFTSEKQKELQPLVDINIKIVEQVLQQPGTIIGGSKNVVNPFTFIKDDFGYIMYKKRDGTNVLLTVKKVDGTWTFIKQVSKQGKPMKSELLWYM
ncbi:hypothetical protein QFZ77_004723 [Paenibacillus sp. V4I3]|uniref:DUF3888 domain-containing protein n=1 Tax=Paenibacillus sp. V4I3 TaxID=3042305 RepID=UPI00278B22E1|nr:DUF3888 domain-containing protein [Paenibacillus sp. V4I3]MDQ0876064.1 hypothetical protein [Paenibacillus sp. V4I3]